ncbi:putative efflux pump [Hypoxylon sp. NC1633]|nr:putative efflux pump [Hypoxylon sp. NC1633]
MGMLDKKGQSSLEMTSQTSVVAPSNNSMTDSRNEAKTVTSSSESTRSIVVDEKSQSIIGPDPGLARHATAKSHHGDSIRQTQTREDGSEYPTGAKLSLITLALCLSVFLMALDNSIIATAIPKITDAFHSLPDVGWYGSAYLLTTAALQLLFGKFYTFLSIKWVFLTAIGIFELGSLICGVAQNSVTLIIGRAVAGSGGAGIMSGALLILAYSVPLAKRPMYTGLVTSMYGIASVAGPLLGGVFTDKVTWRWCFFINLPIGAITILVILFFFPEPTRTMPADESLMERVRRFDPVGTILFMPSIICLLLALQWGGTEYPWNNGRIIGLFVVFAVLIIAFLYVQHIQQEHATVPPRIMKMRTMWASSLYAFGVGSGFFIMVYYVPIWFQSVQGLSAVDSGIRNLPMLISVVVFAMIAGILVTVFGYYAPFMVVGTVLMSIGGGLLSTWNPDTTAGAWIGYQILFGAGVGMGMQQPLMAAQTVLDIKDVPTGTSVLVFVQTVGGALFVSVGQTVFTNKLVQELAGIPGLDSSSVLNAGATNLVRTLPAELLPKVVLAYSDALTTAFIVGTALVAFTVFGSLTVEWKSVKGKKIEAALA